MHLRNKCLSPLELWVQFIRMANFIVLSHRTVRPSKTLYSESKPNEYLLFIFNAMCLMKIRQILIALQDPTGTEYHDLSQWGRTLYPLHHRCGFLVKTVAVWLWRSSHFVVACVVNHHWVAFNLYFKMLCLSMDGTDRESYGTMILQLLRTFQTESCIEYTSPWPCGWIELTTPMVINTYCVGACKFYYHIWQPLRVVVV
jgi:hypothetical protein